MSAAGEEVDSGAILMRDSLKLEGHELNEEIRRRLGEKIADMCLRLLATPEQPVGEDQQGGAKLVSTPADAGQPPRPGADPRCAVRSAARGG